jgi:hypothetical protein
MGAIQTKSVLRKTVARAQRKKRHQEKKPPASGTPKAASDT